MMKQKSKRYSPDEKVAILRRHLQKQVPVSELCREHDLHPNVFYRWRKEFFEGGAATFEQVPGAHPRIVSDNGPQVIAQDFKEFIRLCEMTHVRTSPHYPQGTGKLERWHKSLKGECIRPNSPVSLADAQHLVAAYVEHPIYYFWDGKTFAFCSEIEGLAILLQNALRLNHRALAFYSTLGYIPAPYTIYHEIQKLEPGHFIVLRNGVLTKQQYWDIDFSRKEHRSLKALLQEIPQKLGEAVSSQLVIDVPLGAFLSGGIDSSAVVALMCQVAGERVKTFSIGFSEKDFDETPFACIVVERYKTYHYDFRVTPDAMSVLPRLVEHFGEPFADSSTLPTYYLSAMTRNHVKVALSGNGGDELFCGYTIYLGHQISHLYRLLPRTLRKLILRCIKELHWSDHYRSNQILWAMQKRSEDAELDPVKRVFSKGCMFLRRFLGLLGFNTSIRARWQSFLRSCSKATMQNTFWIECLTSFSAG